MLQHVKAPDLKFQTHEKSIFLAGSIEMDTADQWQNRFVQHFLERDVTVYNPRRDNWDSSWKQTFDDINFVWQVQWELDHLEKADLIVFYFDPNTKSPVTMLELGLMIGRKNIIVCCPDGFWRKGNIEVVCGRFGIPVLNSFEELLNSTTGEWRNR